MKRLRCAKGMTELQDSIRRDRAFWLGIHCIGFMVHAIAAILARCSSIAAANSPGVLTRIYFGNISARRCCSA
jgi:hypothetical protein